MKPDRREVGLCLDCRHARAVPTALTLYWLCRRSVTDPAYDRYPRLPVLRCPGYERASPGEGPERAED